MQYSDWAANASFSSIVSTSFMVAPALFRAFSAAGIGPIPNNCQSTPATARLTISALVFNPRFSAKESLVIKRAAAPIENGLLVAAVTVPFTINAGLNSNIKKDLAVINEKGLVGKVILTSKNNSKILLINDQSSSVPVKTLSDKSFSILSGTSDGRYLISSFIKDTKMPKVGDLLVTSGNAKIFPRDILVAKVVKVNLDHYLAIPYVDFKNLSYIQVINSK